MICKVSINPLKLWLLPNNKLEVNSLTSKANFQKIKKWLILNLKLNSKKLPWQPQLKLKKLYKTLTPKFKLMEILISPSKSPLLNIHLKHHKFLEENLLLHNPNKLLPLDKLFNNNNNK